jgi:hypothetical protein
VVLRKPVQIIVMSVTVVTLPVFIELLRDAAYTLSRDRHVIVTVTVTEETPYLSGFLAGVTVMTLMTMICGRFLAGVPLIGQGLVSPPESSPHGDQAPQSDYCRLFVRQAPSAIRSIRCSVARASPIAVWSAPTSFWFL